MRRRDVQGFGDFGDRPDGGVLFGALYAADIGSIQASRKAQVLLSQASLLSQEFEILTDLDHNIHVRQQAGMNTIDLQTMSLIFGRVLAR